MKHYNRRASGDFLAAQKAELAKLKERVGVLERERAQLFGACLAGVVFLENVPLRTPQNERLLASTLVRAIHETLSGGDGQALAMVRPPWDAA